jgi:VanZ family protein
MTSRTLRRAAWVLTGIYWLCLFAMTHVPAPRLPQVGVSDKTAHMTAYALLALGLGISLWLAQCSPIKACLLALAIAAAYGAVDEISQIPVGRTADVHDWLADLTGAGAACALVLAIRLVLRGRSLREPSSTP